MSINERSELASSASGERPESLGLLRVAAVTAVVAGAVGSVALTLYAGRHSDSRALVVLFAIWVLSPFVALVLANVASKRWSVLIRATLYSVMLVLTAGSLAIYAVRALRPPRTQAAFVFVVVPPVSWLLIVVVIPTAALISRRLSRRNHGAHPAAVAKGERSPE